MKAGARRAAAGSAGPEGNRGTALSPAWPACTPQAGSSARPLPDLTPPYDRNRARPRPHSPPAPGRPGGRRPRIPPPSTASPARPRPELVPRRRGRDLGLPALPYPKGLPSSENPTPLLTPRTKRNRSGRMSVWCRSPLRCTDQVSLAREGRSWFGFRLGRFCSKAGESGR
jgi:hypothetical protein